MKSWETTPRWNGKWRTRERWRVKNGETFVLVDLKHKRHGFVGLSFTCVALPMDFRHIILNNNGHPLLTSLRLLCAGTQCAVDACAYARVRVRQRWRFNNAVLLRFSFCLLQHHRQQQQCVWVRLNIVALRWNETISSLSLSLSSCVLCLCSMLNATNVAVCFAVCALCAVPFDQAYLFRVEAHVSWRSMCGEKDKEKESAETVACFDRYSYSYDRK